MALRLVVSLEATFYNNFRLFLDHGSPRLATGDIKSWYANGMQVISGTTKNQFLIMAKVPTRKYRGSG